MLTPRTTLARRVTAALDASPSRIPVLVGGCGSGRTTLLRQLRERIGRTAVQHIDVERTATTPERFLRAVTAVSPFPVSDASAPAAGARAAFDATLAFFARARTAASEPATFLLDEFLELRTFESFPGLRRVLHDCIDGLAASGNRFVLTSRYVARTLRLLRDRSARFEVIHMPALTAEDTPTSSARPRRPAAATTTRTTPTTSRAPCRRSPTAGRSTSARSPTSSPRCASTAAPAAATRSARWPALLAPDGRLARQCDFSYELRLHRARGYGALKAILEILGDEEGLTLTEISHRLQRTPGSTKDYLSWLEDVDLVDVAAEALHLHRSAAARLGAAALPRLGADRRRPRARSAPLRAAAAAAADRAAAAPRRPSRRSRWPAGRPRGPRRDHRDRLVRVRNW